MEIVFFFSGARWERFIVVEYDIDYSLLFLSVQKFRLSVIYIYPFSVFPLGVKKRKKGWVPPSPLHLFKKKKTDDKNQNKSFLLTFTRHSERTPPRHKTTRTKTTRTTRRRKRIQKRKSNTSSTKTATSFRNTFQWTSSSNRTTSSTSRSCILR